MRTTKIELAQINARLASENAVLRTQVSQLQADFMRVTAVASELNKVQRGEPRTVAMRTAREEAMRTGRCIKV